MKAAAAALRQASRPRGRPAAAAAAAEAPESLQPRTPFANHVWQHIHQLWRQPKPKRTPAKKGGKGSAAAAQREGDADAAAAAAALQAGRGDRLEALVAPRVGALLIAHPRLVRSYPTQVPQLQSLLRPS